ncbi:S49 family peptidase [Thiorhodospira sibirica]|uniref:S49 family peptidase n=1 Tax=Thiorhodospira sibirica TaxID=154347 RepID=UPI00022C58D6|nr:S49 family peptidase [Thiorhodospira sibirica]
MFENFKEKDSPQWEREMLERIALAGIQEQRRARRWGIFFKTLGFLYLFALLYLLIGDDFGSSAKVKKHTAMVDVQGIITQDGAANADLIVSGLRSAFEDANTVGVLLRINSPGGSPVQAGYINDEIVRLRAQYPDIPLYAVITDIGASGGYYIAASADGIYAARSSIVGSIGVRMDSFGLVDAIDKLGIERRLLVAGENKGMLDPFLPLNTQEVAHVQALLDRVYQHFVEVVKTGRGERLANDPEVFSGLIWTGEEALQLGLIDGLGSPGYVAREVIGEANIVDFTAKKDFFTRMSENLGVSLARVMSQGLTPSLR